MSDGYNREGESYRHDRRLKPGLEPVSEVIRPVTVGETTVGATYEYEHDVNHPPHLTKGGIEAIDVIEAWDLDFCLGTAVKYIARVGRKPGEPPVRDLEKAIWYLQRRIYQLKKATP